ncbi:MAG: CYTH domain-containing protein [Oscillospiraceae bacterium]|nr:CYTH domain-containing protein [Oscillospiraceae bacterium]
MEFKLAVPDTRVLEEILFDKEIAAVRQGGYVLYDMATVYYDTENRDLSKRKWTLRLRQENMDLIATVKTPVRADQTRGEWECPARNMEEAIEGLIRAGAPRELIFLTANGVQPLCLARFSRRAAQVKFADGTVCELAGDVGIVAAGQKESPICEIEVELKEGDGETARAFAVELMERFGLQQEPLSKFQRAAALVEG